MRIQQGTALVLAAIGLALVLPLASADEGGPLTFDSAEAAAKALVDAAANNDTAGLLKIFGPGSEDIVNDGDDPIVQVERKSFAQAAVEKLTLSPLEGGATEIVVGDEEWPFPILLVQKDGKWRFDVEDGREELLARRIGRNELEAIQILGLYYEAQRAYASADRDDDEVLEFAQRILSTKGRKDGLYWAADPAKGEELSPVGPAVITIQEAISNFEPKGQVPFNGYYWKILTGQGPSAPGGEHSYVINGNMIAGFALVGTPARHGSTGIMSFLVSHHGKMYEKDLGENGLETAKAMEVFDPTDGWTEVMLEEEAE